MNKRLNLALARQLETMAPMLKICSVLWRLAILTVLVLLTPAFWRK